MASFFFSSTFKLECSLLPLSSLIMLSCDNKGLDDKDDADENENGDDKEDPDDEESDVERSEVKVKVDDDLVGDVPFIG